MDRGEIDDVRARVADELIPLIARARSVLVGTPDDGRWTNDVTGAGVWDCVEV